MLRLHKFMLTHLIISIYILLHNISLIIFLNLLLIFQRKSRSDNQTLPKPWNPSKSKNSGMVMEPDEPYPLGYDEDNSIQQRPTRLKRTKKSVNENLEPAYTPGASKSNMISGEYHQQSPYDYNLHDYGGGGQ